MKTFLLNRKGHTRISTLMRLKSITSKLILYKPRLNADLSVNVLISFVQRVFKLFGTNICLKSNISVFLLMK